MSTKHAIYGRLPGETVNLALAKAFGDCLALAPGDRLAVLSSTRVSDTHKARLEAEALRLNVRAFGEDGMHAAYADTDEPVPWGLLTLFHAVEPALDVREPMVVDHWVRMHGTPHLADIDYIGFIAYEMGRPSLDGLAAASSRTLALMESSDGLYVPVEGAEEELISMWGRFVPHRPHPLDWDTLRSSAMEVSRGLAAAELRGALDFNSFLWLAR